MIIGHGDIASVLPEKDDLLFFASGVSNSQEKRYQEYDRETELLIEHMKGRPEQRLVYFSSLSVFTPRAEVPDAKLMYWSHKHRMEKMVKKLPHYTIIRIGNITWGTNPNTLINHFKAMASSGEPLDIQDTTRYIVEKEEFLHWINLIPNWNCEMNIPGRIMTIQEIVDKYVAPHFHAQ
jgi:nucleoside-diphosphate-sugar epimerase